LAGALGAGFAASVHGMAMASAEVPQWVVWLRWPRGSVARSIVDLILERLIGAKRSTWVS